MLVEIILKNREFFVVFHERKAVDLLFRVDLGAAENENSVFFRHVTDDRRLPRRIVVGYPDDVESLFRSRFEDRRRAHFKRATRGKQRVDVKIRPVLVHRFTL